MSEWFLLLLPLAAASGWWAATRSAQRAGGGGAPDPAYFRGLNYLLDDQPDKAIDVFVKLAEMDSETAEVQLALGGLFRRRGEVDRAIRVHQGLMARQDLPKPLRALALRELAQDYMRAGLFDRAERLFEELTEFRDHRRLALTSLLDIYQQEKDWRRCLETADRLQSRLGEKMGLAMAHYQCELAEEALRQGDDAGAETCLRHALATDPGCVRATLLQARLLLDRGEADRAIHLYRRVGDQGPRFLPEILPGLQEAFRGRPPTDLLETLRALHREHPNGALLLALADAVERVEGRQSAIRLLVDYVGGHADLAAVERLLELRELPLTAEGAEALAMLRTLGRVARYLRSRQPRYQCDHCGFVARRLHWQCPGCKHWASILPVQPATLGDGSEAALV